MIYMTPSRRSFFIQSLSCASALSALTVANTVQAQTLVLETDPAALAIGYKANAKDADTKKYPNYAANQSCSACVLFQGKPGDDTGGCPVFGNKMVSKNGWCSAWAKKA